MSENNLYKEKGIFLPGNICNNNFMIWQNQTLFKRNFVLPTNVKDGKLYFKHMYIGPREEPTSRCTNSNIDNQIKKIQNQLNNQPKNQNKGINSNCPNQYPECISCCSGFSKVIDTESDLFMLDYPNTLCPSKKFQIPKINNHIPSQKCPPPPIDNNIVGIKNPSQEMCPESEWAITGPGSWNVRNICNDPARLNKCEFNNYLRGNNAAGAETDITYNLRIKNCRSPAPPIPIENNWVQFSEISNLSSDIPYKPIKDQLVNYTYYKSKPFMLEDVRVRNKPVSNQQECTNLFNNMTRRKSLFQEV